MLVNCYTCKNDFDFFEEEEESNILRVDMSFKKTKNIDNTIVVSLYFCCECFEFANLKAEYLTNAITNEIEKNEEKNPKLRDRKKEVKRSKKNDEKK